MRSNIGVVGAVGVLVMLTVGTARQAWACSYAVSVVPFGVPTDGQQDVPVNTRVWMDGYSADQMTVTDENDAVVAGAVTTLSGSASQLETMSLLVFTPSEELRPNHTYRVSSGERSVTFHTGGGRLEGVPEAPVVKSRRYHRDGPRLFPCGVCTAGASFELEHQGILLVGVLNDAPDLDVQRLSGFASVLTVRKEVTLPDAEACDKANASDVRFAVVDAAGHVSAWTTDQSNPYTCQCASIRGGVPPVTLGAVCVGAVLAARQRRKTRTATDRNPRLRA